jgi:type IV pilus assembly protein PilP
MKRIKTIIFCSLLFVLVGSGFAFCEDQALPSVETEAAETEKSAVDMVVPTVTVSEDGLYSYNPLGKPDPFKPFVQVELPAAKKDEEKKAAESIFPLQRVSVGNFRVVGIAGDQSRRVAVLEDAARKFYPIFVGTRIGLRNGKVTEILADRVVVDEYEDKKVKRVILKLRKNI